MRSVEGISAVHGGEEVKEAMPENIRDWECPSCGTRHDRDINAAKNVLAAGLAVTACGAPVRPNSQKRGRHGQ